MIYSTRINYPSMTKTGVEIFIALPPFFAIVINVEAYSVTSSCGFVSTIVVVEVFL